MLVADPLHTDNPEELDTFSDELPTVFFSLDDDEENIGFDDLEDIDDDEFDDDEFDDDEDEDEDFDDEEEDDDFDDDDFDDDDFDDDDDDDLF